ncbi:hypothetical protein TNCV_1794541 [Trichonephila clavipes]|nr:hypothetical protein TNCV_1794541 [Trichonephila clavipes]
MERTRDPLPALKCQRKQSLRRRLTSRKKQRDDIRSPMPTHPLHPKGNSFLRQTKKNEKLRLLLVIDGC